MLSHKKNHQTHIELFKILIKIQCEKSELLKDTVPLIQKEIEVKSKSIEKLTDFIVSVIGDNFECVSNDDNHTRKALLRRTGTPNKHDNITTRRKTKWHGGFPKDDIRHTEREFQIIRASKNNSPSKSRISQKVLVEKNTLSTFRFA